MLDQENCVARLHVLAEKLSNHPEGDVQGIFAQVLGSDPNTVEFHRRLVALVDLGKRARQQVDEIAGDPNYELYVQVIDSIVATLEQVNMRENWSRYRATFTPHAMALLLTCERAVGSRLTATMLNEEAIGEALAEVRDAIGGVLDADIDAEAKQLLLEILREAESALLAYQISGLAGLRRTVERLVGMYELHKQRFNQYQGHSAVDRAFKALERFVIVSEMVGYIRQLPGVDYIIEKIKMLAE